MRAQINALKSKFASAANEDEEEKSDLKSLYIKLLQQNKMYVDPAARAKKLQQQRQSYVGTTWGMTDDAEVYAFNEEEEAIKLDPVLMRQLPDLTTKQLDKINEYEKKSEELDNLERELQHIMRTEKEEYGLTEAQKLRRQALETKVNELESQVQILDDNLRFILFHEQKLKKEKAQRLADEDTFNDDDFYDRTLVVKKQKLDEKNAKITGGKEAPTQTVETYHTLKSRLEELLAEREETSAKILNFDKKMNETAPAEEELDDLDRFMMKNEQSLLQKDETSVIARLKELNEEIEKTQQLLTVVKPDFRVNVQELIEKREREKIEKEMRTAKEKERKERARKIFDLPKAKIESSSNAADSQGVAEKPTKKEAVVVRTNTVATPVEEEVDVEEMAKMNIPVTSYDEEKQTPKQSSAVREQNLNTAESTTKSGKRVYGVASRPAPRNIREKDVESNDDFVDLVAPRGQSGDGMTRLNQKYGYQWFNSNSSQLIILGSSLKKFGRN
eukprot:TRINITY_DN13496_c0_g1_i2.p1 TRINITY_DN13496_c0_g1~~TRINITY_DN13496_c0_g1_i2.p1  ORF type:complete len:503 (+),score=153.07 TRINITY_DN13496_c0_g1_i2:505-2013(+)